jgi:hypothetical protein
MRHSTIRATALSNLLLLVTGVATAAVIPVDDDASLRAALAKATAGTVIRIAPGRYAPGLSATGLRGTAEKPIVIEGADPDDPPIFEGGAVAIQLSDCEHLRLRNLVAKGQQGNGINIDDGGTVETPTHHIVLSRVRVLDTGPRGNCDGIKLSGVNDFVVRDCVIEGWGGQAVDMVGCHRGVVEGCAFRGKPGFSQATGPQTKGGSSDIAIRRCEFTDAGSRAVNVGGSTGLPYFRPPGARHEAKDITVEGCVFSGSQTAVAFVGVDGATFRYNTVIHPGKWVLRILQETVEPGFVPCRGGRFERNLVVFRRSEVQVAANVGPDTAPETFTFAANLWFSEDRPEESRPDLPAKETDGVYGVDPRLPAPGDGRPRPQDPRATRYGAEAWPGPATGK